VLAAAAVLLTAQGCTNGQQDDRELPQDEIPEAEFRSIARSLATEAVSAESLASVLRRASVHQGSQLVISATLPRRSGHAEALALLVRIWEHNADDIPLSVQPIFRLSVASALHKLEPQRCAGCYEYARELLSAGDVEVRGAAALAMATLGSSEDVEVLRVMIVQDEVSVAQSAAAALTGLDESGSVEILRDLVNDPAVSASKRSLLSQTIEAVERRRAARDQR
jgi:hypothetical protein